ncbi:MAG: alkane 1-monooxygenase [Bacteroidia bacterium]
MISLGPLRYYGAFIFIVLAYFGFTSEGIWSYSIVIFAFFLVPLVELITSPNKTFNSSENISAYNVILILLTIAYSYLLVHYLTTINETDTLPTLLGKILTMGILMGVFGINMAHELGHRKEKIFQVLAQFLLCTSQYTHFFIEHNRGHHKKVATPDDPATARKDENIYVFWVRSIRDGYKSAWLLENNALKRKQLRWFSWRNDMVRYTFFQIVLIVLVFLLFGLVGLMAYLASCLVGILLLESINYVEHYGLVRSKISDSAYERVQYKHSWNSDHPLGRYLLFELTRHSHHHENSLIPYPNLESKDESPQLPTGDSGMLLLSLIPPLFFKVMNKRLPK